MHAFSQNSQNWLAVKFDPKSVMMVFGKLKRCKISEMKSTTRSGVSLAIGLYSIHQHMGETAWRRCEGPNHIKALASKGPGWQYGDEAVGWNMRLLAEELTILAPTHEILRIGYRGGPPETSPVCFPHQRS
jgi:hypothetical protein